MSTQAGNIDFLKGLAEVLKEVPTFSEGEQVTSFKHQVYEKVISFARDLGSLLASADEETVSKVIFDSQGNRDLDHSDMKMVNFFKSICDFSDAVAKNSRNKKHYTTRTGPGNISRIAFSLISNFFGIKGIKGVSSQSDLDSISETVIKRHTDALDEGAKRQSISFRTEPGRAKDRMPWGAGSDGP